MKSPKHWSIVVDLRPHFLCVYIIMHFLATDQRGGREQERVDGKRNTEISVQSFNTRRVKYKGYPAVNGINYLMWF